MTDTLTTSAPSVIVASLRRASRYLGNPLDDGIWGRSARFGINGDANTFNGWVARRDGWAMAQLAEAHALDVLHDAYAIAAIEHSVPNVFAQATGHSLGARWEPGTGWTDSAPSLPVVDPFAAIDAQIHDEFPGPLPDAKLSKLRALAQEKLDLKSEIERLAAPITDGHDPRIRDLMVKAAKTANAHDYCEVYDIIAGEIGLWNREELGLREETYVFSITGTGTVQEMRQALKDAHPTFSISIY